MAWKMQPGLLSLSLLIAVLLSTSMKAADSEVGRECPCICSECSIKSTLCTTNITEPFPLTLDPKTEALYIFYKGREGFSLTATMIAHYKSLTELTITGNLSFVEDRAFTSSRIKSLTIHHSRIRHLPSSTFGGFGTDSTLKILHLDNNPLLKLIPYNIFHSLPLLEELDISYNSFPVCDKPTIGEEFRSLKSLQTLNLAGLGQQDPVSCKSINKDFFKPLGHVQNLNLSETSFFKGKQTILLPLDKLVELTMNNVSPYKACPALVNELFRNLPDSIQLIYAQYWRIHTILPSNCTISRETLRGLASKKYLRVLDFESGGGIFGSKLRSDTFLDMPQLKQLQLGWCRIAEIEEGALNGLRIEELWLKGNPIGSLVFWAMGVNQSMNTMHKLSLKECAIDSVPVFSYDVSYIVLSFPCLDYLDLSKNFLYTVPTFTQLSKYGSTRKLRELNLNYNNINHLRQNEMSALCKAFPQLQRLDITGNLMTTIEMLCPTLTILHAEKNDLYVKPEINFPTISVLCHLTGLYLADNSLTAIPSYLFENMVNLTELSLIENQISSLDTNQFQYNHQLHFLDLSKNLLDRFDAGIFQNISQLKILYLRSNKITALDESFVSYVESTPSLVTVRLDDNSFDCSCGQLYFQTWVKTSHQLQHGGALICHQPDSLRGEPIASYKQPIVECYVKWGAVGLAVFVGIILALLVLYRFRWYLAHLRFAALSVAERLVDIKQQDECKYDAMVIYNFKSDADTAWVQKLMFELEGGNYPRLTDLEGTDGRVCETPITFVEYKVYV